MEGATIKFECPREHILIGPSTTTCMGNGEWEPDPREVECRGTLLKLLKSYSFMSNRLLLRGFLWAVLYSFFIQCIL